MLTPNNHNLGSDSPDSSRSGSLATTERIPFRFEGLPARWALYQRPGRTQWRFDSRYSASAYRWDGRERHWTSDSLLLGLTGKGTRVFNQALSKISPIAKTTLAQIMWETVLERCEKPPTKLLQMLRQYPGIPDVLQSHSISASLPLYHESGQSKDVYFALLLLAKHPRIWGFPPASRNVSEVFPPLERLDCCVTELMLALKISKYAGAITNGELALHKKLCSVASQGIAPISTLLGWYDLSAYPNLNLSGGIASLEIFEPGHTAAHFVDTEHHALMARSVTHCAFKLFETACRADLAINPITRTSLGSSATQSAYLAVPFSSDINPGNFILNRNAVSILVDAGDYHAHHTFSQIALRTIHEYWIKHDDRKEDGELLPLSAFCETACLFFGREHGTRLLGEFRIYLGLLIGAPAKSLKERFNPELVDSVAKHLKHCYCGAGTVGGFDALKNAVSMQREAFQYELYSNQNRSPTDESFWRRYYHPNTLPYFFSTSRLDRIAKELDRYLRTGTLTLADRTLSARDRSVFAPPIDRKLIAEVLYFTPLPDPSVIRLAVITLGMRSGPISFQKLRNLQQYGRAITGIAASLNYMFENPTLTEALADIVQGQVIQSFAPKVKVNFYRPRPIGIAHVERWIRLLVGLELIYNENGGKFPETLKDSELWGAALQEIHSCPLEQLPVVLRQYFCQDPSALRQITAIQEADWSKFTPGIEAITKILSNRRIPLATTTLPRLVRRYGEI